MCNKNEVKRPPIINNNFASIGFIMLQPVIFVLAIVVSLLWITVFHVSGLRLNLLENHFTLHLVDPRDLRLAFPGIALENACWFVRNTFFKNKHGDYSIKKHIAIPTIAPLFLMLIFYDMSDVGVGFITLFRPSELTVIILLWLVFGLATRGILVALYKVFDKKAANIFAIAIIAISFILIL